MLKLKQEKNPGVCNANDMKDGDVAVIVGWTNVSFIGCIVQRYGSALITLGAPHGSGWSGFFSTGPAEGCLVRILESGETLIV